MMPDTELPLPEFAQLETVPPPPRPRYRCDVTVEVEYSGSIEYQTDEDPAEWLELDANVDAPLQRIVDSGHTDWWGWDVQYGTVEVSYDNGKTWQVWKRDER